LALPILAQKLQTFAANVAVLVYGRNIFACFPGVLLVFVLQTFVKSWLFIYLIVFASINKVGSEIVLKFENNFIFGHKTSLKTQFCAQIL
jgi:hypothetical protein